MATIHERVDAVLGPPGARDYRRELIALFIAAQVGVPIVANLIRWLAGQESVWGWQMFSS